MQITATGGVLSEATSGQNAQFTDEELEAIVSIAKDYNFKVAAHAHGTTAVASASTITAAPPVCPPTFSQAIGEKEYENPVHALSGGNRTQLWKPSRSWWEAKSGKNPWIEPSSHNKRWR